MATQDELLERLRAIFHEELEDRLGAMESAVTVLARREDRASTSAALAELYRAAHTLKGAASSVGLEQTAELCHQLESELAAARQAEALDTAELRGRLDLAMRQLREMNGLAAGEARDAIVETEPPPSRADTSKHGRTGRIDFDRLDGLLVATEELRAAALVRGTRAELDHRLDTLATAVEALGTRPTRASLDRARAGIAAVRLEVARVDEEGRRIRERVTQRTREVARWARTLRTKRLSELAPALERAALETAELVGRGVRFSFSGDEAAADFRVIDGLREPLLHLVRNAVAHGIEAQGERIAAGKAAQGEVAIESRVRGSELTVEVRDDGRGFDAEALERAARSRGVELPDDLGLDERLSLAFLPGVTTAASVDMSSGRGVGMDVVRERIGTLLHGRVELRSRRGEGSTVRMVVPVDLSLMNLMFVEVGSDVFALAAATVLRLTRVKPEALVVLDGFEHLQQGPSLLPVADLATVLEMPSSDRVAKEDTTMSLMIIESSGHSAAFRVDRLLEATQAMVKPLGERVRAPLVQGATLRDDGRVAPLLDATRLCEAARRRARRAGATSEGIEVAAAKILLVDDSVTTRQLVRTILEAAGYRVEVEPDGDGAWARLRRGERFDALVSDIEMPTVSGLELLGRVRATARLRDLPVVLVTALASDEDRRRALDLGADAYLVKSKFDQSELLEIVEELVG